MWSPEALSTINALAAGLAREGRPPHDAIRLFTSPLKSVSEEANRILRGPVCDSCGDSCPVEIEKRKAS